MSVEAFGEQAHKRARQSSSASGSAGPAAEAAEQPEAPRVHTCTIHARLPRALLRASRARLRVTSTSEVVHIEVRMCFSHLLDTPNKAEFQCSLFLDNSTYHLYRVLGKAFGCARAMTSGICLPLACLRARCLV